MIEDPYDKLTNLPPELVARLKAGRDQRIDEINKMKEEFARTFKPRDFVHGAYLTPDGRIDPNSDVFTIARWADDYGNSVYIKIVSSRENYPPEPQIRTLFERIQTQQADFIGLDPSEQSRIRTNFATPGEGIDNGFNDYLNNQAMAQQFQKLK